MARFGLGFFRRATRKNQTTRASSRNTPTRPNANRVLSKAALNKAVSRMNEIIATWEDNEKAIIRAASYAKDSNGRVKALAQFNTQFRPMLQAMKKQRNEVRARGAAVNGPWFITPNGTVYARKEKKQVWHNIYHAMLTQLSQQRVISNNNFRIFEKAARYANEGKLDKNKVPFMFDPKMRARLAAMSARKEDHNTRGKAMKVNLDNVASLKAKLASLEQALETCTKERAEAEERLWFAAMNTFQRPPPSEQKKRRAPPIRNLNLKPIGRQVTK